MISQTHPFGKPTNLALFLFACWFGYKSEAADIEIVIPNDRSNSDGNSASGTPFTSLSIRYQQVFDASQFAPISQAGGWINAIDFKGDEGQIFSFGAVISNIQINASTTLKAPDHLTTVFSENIGLDDRVVYGPGQMILDADKHVFNGRIVFSNPFYYNPNSGNLLLDIRNYSGGTVGMSSGALDAEFTTGDSVSEAIGFINSDTAFLTDSLGLITKFEVTPVPEPSTLLLVLLGGVPMILWLRRRKRTNGSKDCHHEPC